MNVKDIHLYLIILVKTIAIKSINWRRVNHFDIGSLRKIIDLTSACDSNSHEMDITSLSLISRPSYLND